MVTVHDIYTALDSLAPVSRKMDFDNVGLLVGRGDAPVRRVLTALDITESVIEEASASGAELIVSHHPLFFDLKKVNDSDLAGRKVLSLAERRIAAICMHTNLDVSVGGVNDALADVIGIEGRRFLSGEQADGSGNYGLGRYGTVPVSSLADFLSLVKERLGANGLRYIDAGRPVSKVAVCGGSGGSELKRAAELGCDTYVTADVKYNGFLDAGDLGINLIDAGHYSTENVVVGPLRDYLSGKFPQLQVIISKIHHQPEQFF